MGVFGVLPPRLARLAYPPPGTPLQRTITPIQATKRPNPNNLPPTHKSPLKRLILRYSPIRLPRHPKTHATHTSDRAHPERLDTSGRLILISFYGYCERVAAHRVAPRHSPGNAPQTAGTPPGCNGVAPQTETPTAAHRRHRGQKKTPRAEARSVTPSIYSFSTGQREPQKEIQGLQELSYFHPLIEP